MSIESGRFIPPEAEPKPEITEDNPVATELFEVDEPAGPDVELIVDENHSEPIADEAPDAKKSMETALESILPERDREIIREGLRVLESTLEKKERLPEVLIFPDTSGRPLAYAVRPILRKVYEARGLPVPQLVFMKTERYPMAATYDYLLSEMKSQGTTLDQALTEYYGGEHPGAHTNNQLQKVIEMRKVMKTRADQIRDKLHLENGAQMMIVDDYATTSAMTIREVRAAMNASVPESEVAAFAFQANAHPNYMWREIKITTAVQDLMSYNDGTAGEGFAYRRARGEIIGVSKHDKHNPLVKRDESADPEAMIAFRHKLAEIGEEIAKEKSRH